MAKVGLEMKLLTSEVEAEAEKWDEYAENDIVKRAKVRENLTLTFRIQMNFRLCHLRLTACIYSHEAMVRSKQLMTYSHKLNSSPNKPTRCTKLFESSAMKYSKFLKTHSSIFEI